MSPYASPGLVAVQDLKSGCMQVRKVAEENGVDLSGHIRELEERAKQVCISFPSCVLFTSHDMPHSATLLCDRSALTVSAVRLAKPEHASGE